MVEARSHSKSRYTMRDFRLPPEIDEMCALLGCKSQSTTWPLKMRPIGCPDTSVQNYHSTLRNIPNEHRSHVR
jgi:hypothetical protein